MIEATNASDAYRLAVVHEPKVIVLEVALAGQNGWGLLERLTHLPLLAKIPVIVISVSGDEARSKSLGAIAHLKKPVPTQQLVQVLKELGQTPVSTANPPTSPATKSRAAAHVA